MPSVRDRGDRWRRDPISGWLAFTVGAGAAFTLLVLVVVVSPAADQLDAAISEAIRSMRTPQLTAFALAVTQLGSAAVVIGVSILVAIWLAWRRSAAGIVYLFCTVGLGWFLGDVLIKNLLHRQRPDVLALIPVPSSYALPSGHALASCLLCAAIVVIVMLETPTGRHVKRWVFAAAVLVTLLVGWSRVYLGVHWFGDIVAAWLFGLTWWSFTTATYFGSVRSGFARRQQSHPGPG